MEGDGGHGVGSLGQRSSFVQGTAVCIRRIAPGAPGLDVFVRDDASAPCPAAMAPAS